MSELRVDNIVSQDGSSAPVYSQGVIVGSGKTFTVRGDVDFQSGANVSGAVTFSHLSVGNGFSVSGVVTATSFSGNVTGTATGLTGTPSIAVQNATVQGDLTVNGTTTTLDTNLIDVDRVEVGANGTNPAIAVTQSGSGLAIQVEGGHVKLGDSDHLYFGDNNGLDIYHASDYTLIQHMPQGIFAIENANTGAGSDLYLTAGEDITLRPNGGNNGIQIIKQGAVRLYWNNTQRLTTGVEGITVTGTVSDSIGPLRRLGIQASSSSFSLAADHAGKLVRSTGNSSTLTIPQNVFSAGDMISIFNVSTGNNTIAQGSGTTLYNTNDASTGNRTLGPKGVCTIVCTADNEFIISGTQLT